MANSAKIPIILLLLCLVCLVYVFNRNIYLKDEKSHLHTSLESCGAQILSSNDERNELKKSLLDAKSAHDRYSEEAIAERARLSKKNALDKRRYKEETDSWKSQYESVKSQHEDVQNQLVRVQEEFSYYKEEHTKADERQLQEYLKLKEESSARIKLLEDEIKSLSIAKPDNPSNENSQGDKKSAVVTAIKTPMDMRQAKVAKDKVEEEILKVVSVTTSYPTDQTENITQHIVKAHGRPSYAEFDESLNAPNISNLKENKDDSSQGLTKGEMTERNRARSDLVKHVVQPPLAKEFERTNVEDPNGLGPEPDSAPDAEVEHEQSEV